MMISIFGILSQKVTVVAPPSGVYALPVSDWNLQNMDIINGNDFRPNAGDARAWSTSFIPAGGVGEIRGRSNITIFGLDRQLDSQPYYQLDYAVWRAANGNAGSFNNNNGTENVNVPDGTILRCRCTGTQVFQEYSLDEGVTWGQLIPPSDQIQEKLYAKMSTDPGEYLDDVLVSGFVTA